MSNEYQLADGSPRYGHRTDSASTVQATTPGIAPTDVAEGAARLSLDVMAGAIDRQLRSAWADEADPAVEALRTDNPEELAAARALVRLHLGTQRQWRTKAQAVWDQQLAGTLARRRAGGRVQEILALRLGLMAALIAPPAYIAATSPDDLLKLLVAGIACFVFAVAGGYWLTCRAKVPVMPVIRGPWLQELREDVVNATLVAILQNKGTPLDPGTAAAARRGWENIQATSQAVSSLNP